jgi:uncharacterized metal-binding protein
MSHTSQYGDTIVPGAHTHDLITVAAAGALAPLTYVALQNQGLSVDTLAFDIGLLVGAHLLSGFMFSPDLDIDSAIDNRWGPFFWIWRPYMWAVPHRSRLLSHGLVIPPLLRIVYFCGVVTLAFLGVARLLARVGIIVPDYPEQAFNALLNLARMQPREVLLFLIGFITGGATHTLTDWTVSGGRHMLHRLGIHHAHDFAHHDDWRRAHQGRSQ